MRFEEWDVLLFPKDSKVPMKEFKTNCHVVHDTGMLLPASIDDKHTRPLTAVAVKPVRETVASS